MPITPANWDRISQLLDQALDLEPASRGQWIESLGVEHADLRDILRELLAGSAGAETSDFLQRLPEFSAPNSAAGVASGDLVGPYRLIREVGRGGMATVWLAERADGSLQRKVALKLPHLAWTDRGFADRMTRERDILAVLEHPNIARLYDAGVDEAGRPFLALEFVGGLPLDVHCSTHPLKLWQRLDLFLQIARAVSFAHARLIVHRDLKPSNVLVRHDGEVRLLDFGIARLLQAEIEQATHHTQFGGRLLTPSYAAPEQFTGQPITVATDVYSLGVLLHEMLTGVSPYLPKSTSSASLEEAVLQGDPVLPSSVTQAVPAHALRGDLDNIIAKALKKSPQDRYSSVEALATDIERHLLGHPITASRPSAWYRTSKFVRRNALLVSVATTAVMALSIGLGTSVWQWREATRQRTVAVDMLANAEATLDFTRSVLTEGMRSDETVTIAELLSRSEEIVAKLGQNNSRALAFAADFLANWYLTFGQADKAEKLLTRTIDALPADARALATSSLVCTRASAWAQLGRTDEAIAATTAEIVRSGNDAATAAYCLQTRAELAIGVNDASGALQYALDALRSYNAAGQRSSRDKSVLLADTGYAYSLNGKADLAQNYYQQAFELLERTGHSGSHDAAAVLNNWGIAMIEIGNPLKALELFDQAVAITRRRSPVGDPDPNSIANLAAALRTLARYPEAAAAYDTQLRMARLDGNAVGEAYALVGSARVATKLGQFDQAQQFLDAAAAKTREGRIPAASPGSLMQKVALGQLWAAQGRSAEGTAMLTEAVDSYKKLGCCHAAKALALISRAEIALAQAHLEPAAADATSALQIAQSAQGTAPFSNATGSAWLMLGRVRQSQGRFSEAKRAYELAARHLAGTVGENHPDTQRARQGIADIA